jgi:hypothetical protein
VIYGIIIKHMMATAAIAAMVMVTVAARAVARAVARVVARVMARVVARVVVMVMQPMLHRGEPQLCEVFPLAQWWVWWCQAGFVLIC